MKYIKHETLAPLKRWEIAAAWNIRSVRSDEETVTFLKLIHEKQMLYDRGFQVGAPLGVSGEAQWMEVKKYDISHYIHFL